MKIYWGVRAIHNRIRSSVKKQVLTEARATRTLPQVWIWLWGRGYSQTHDWMRPQFQTWNPLFEKVNQ